MLARLEQETLKVQLAQNDAGLARTQAAIAQANSNIIAAEARREESAHAFERAQPLKKSGHVSESVFDQRESAAKTAAAQLLAARDALALAEADKALSEAQRRDIQWKLGKTEVKAPTDGIISRRNSRIGGLATGAAVADPMFRIINNGEIELEGEVPEADLATLTTGQLAEIKIAGSEQLREASSGWSRRKSTRPPGKGRVRILLIDGSKLRTGSFGRASIATRSATGIVVPASAVLFGADGPSVQVVTADRVTTRKVVVGIGTGAIVRDPAGARGRGDRGGQGRYLPA